MDSRVTLKHYERRCRVCGDVKRFPREFRPASRVCSACFNAAHAEEQRQRSAARRAARKAALRAARPTSPNPSGGCRGDNGVFERTVAALVPHWGAYHGWTRAQHRAHTAWLARLSGVALRTEAPVYDPADVVTTHDHTTERAA